MSEPPITQLAAKHGGANGPITRVVIHCTDPSSIDFPEAAGKNQAEGTCRYFAEGSGGRNASAHYVEDIDSETHCVPDDVLAYHAPPNHGSLGIEIGGRAHWTRDQWLADEVWPAVERARGRTIELCARHGVPFVKLDSAALLRGEHGVCGHIDVSNAWHDTTHTDPGPGFPWDRFMDAGTAPAPPDEEDDMFTDDDRKLLQDVRNGLLVDIAEGRDDATTKDTASLGTMVKSMWRGDYGDAHPGAPRGSLGWLDRRLKSLGDHIVAKLCKAIGVPVPADDPPAEG